MQDDEGEEEEKEEEEKEEGGEEEIGSKEQDRDGHEVMQDEMGSEATRKREDMALCLAKQWLSPVSGRSMRVSWSSSCSCEVASVASTSSGMTPALRNAKGCKYHSRRNNYKINSPNNFSM